MPTPPAFEPHQERLARLVGLVHDSRKQGVGRDVRVGVKAPFAGTAGTKWANLNGCANFWQLAVCGPAALTSVMMLGSYHSHFYTARRN